MLLVFPGKCLNLSWFYFPSLLKGKWYFSSQVVKCVPLPLGHCLSHNTMTVLFKMDFPFFMSWLNGMLSIKHRIEFYLAAVHLPIHSVYLTRAYHSVYNVYIIICMMYLFLWAPWLLLFNLLCKLLLVFPNSSCWNTPGSMLKYSVDFFSVTCSFDDIIQVGFTTRLLMTHTRVPPAWASFALSAPVANLLPTISAYIQHVSNLTFPKLELQMWSLILNINLAGSWCPDMWLNIILVASGKVFFGWD